MNILHLCSYYIKNKLYKNLIGTLAEKGVNQEVFVPVREKSHQGANALSKEQTSVTIHFPFILKKYHRYFYFTKIKMQQRVLEEKVSIGDVDVIHAHTVFSDGGTAYRIHRKTGTPYIVSVRGTDINRFYKKGIHLRPFMYKVLRNAEAVIFLSPAYKKYLIPRLPEADRTAVEKKTHVIPNGIEEHWISNPPQETNPEKKNGAWLFIGALNKNKNVDSLFEAFSHFYQKGKKMRFHLIGSGPEEEQLKRKSRELGFEDNVIFHGFIDDPEEIRRIMGDSSFLIMASHKETFGLVYVEALSQGLPVIYSRGQGFDGYFEEGEVGYSVDSRNVKSIIDGVQKTLNNYDRLRLSGPQKAKQFRWEKVANRICRLYKDGQRSP